MHKQSSYRWFETPSRTYDVTVMCISSISSKQILLIYTDIVCEIRWVKLSWYPQSFETIGQMKWVLWPDDGYFARFQGLCTPSGRTSYRTISSTRPRKVSEARDPVSELSNCFEIWCEVTANFKAIRTFDTRSRAFHALRELMIRRPMRYLIWPQASLYTVVCINKSTIPNHPNPAGKKLTAKLQKLDFSVYYMLWFFFYVCCVLCLIQSSSLYHNIVYTMQLILYIWFISPVRLSVNWVKIISDHDLLTFGNKPLPDAMMTYY